LLRKYLDSRLRGNDNDVVRDRDCSLKLCYGNKNTTHVAQNNYQYTAMANVSV